MRVLISIRSPLIPPLSPSSRAAQCRSQMPTFFSPPLDIKCLSVPSRPPSRSLLLSTSQRPLHFTLPISPVTPALGVTRSSRCRHCSWQRRGSPTMCAPLLDKPFEIHWFGQLITPIPEGASRHRSRFVFVQAKCSAAPLKNKVHTLKIEIWRFLHKLESEANE